MFSGVIEYLLKGKIPANHRDFKKLCYKKALEKMSNGHVQNGQNGDINGAVNDNEIDHYGHNFDLSSAVTPEFMPYTNYT